MFGQLDIWRSTAMTMPTTETESAGSDARNVSFDDDDENVPVVAADGVHVPQDEDEEQSEGRSCSAYDRVLCREMCGFFC